MALLDPLYFFLKEEGSNNPFQVHKKFAFFAFQIIPLYIYFYPVLANAARNWTSVGLLLDAAGCSLLIPP